MPSATSSTLRRARPKPSWTPPTASSATPSSRRRSLSVRSPAACFILPFTRCARPSSSSRFMDGPPLSYLQDPVPEPFDQAEPRTPELPEPLTLLSPLASSRRVCYIRKVLAGLGTPYLGPDTG